MAVPVATGFVVRAIGSSPDVRFNYLITARHVIEDDAVAAVIIRANTKDGKWKHIDTDPANWRLSDDADLAILPLPHDSDLDVLAIPTNDFVGPGPDYSMEFDYYQNGVRKHTIRQFVQPGDEIEVIGLFVDDYGETTNLPIVRVGHIARMPSNVHTPRWKGDGKKSPAYLIECLSWGGLSGSPVVFSQVNQKLTETPVGHEIRLVTKPMLLGFINSHKSRREKAMDSGGEDLKNIYAKLNTGIAVVTPSCAIFEALQHPDLVQQRRAALARIEKMMEVERIEGTSLDSDSDEANRQG